MKTKIIILVGFFVLITSPSIWVYAETVISGNDKKIETLRIPPSDSKKLGRYEGRFPCVGCNAVKVSLLLYVKLSNNKPSTFLLERIHVGSGDDRIICSGKWYINEKKSDTDLKRIILTGDCQSQFTRYLLISDKVAVLLDNEGNPKIGNAQLNFTLSMVD